MWHYELRRQRHFTCRLISGADSHTWGQCFLLAPGVNRHTVQEPTKYTHKNIQAPGDIKEMQTPPNFFLEHLFSSKPEQGVEELALYSKSPYDSWKKWFSLLRFWPARFFPKRGIIQVRSWAQQEGASSRTGRSTPQLSSYMGQKAHREDKGSLITSPIML